MAIDYTQSPDDVLVALINEENDRTFTVADLVLHNLAIAPDPVSGRDAFNNVRTALRVDAAQNSGYINGVDITYNRVNLRDVFPNNDPPSVRYPVSTDAGYVLGERTNLVDILPDVNTRYGINIQASDVFDNVLPTFEGPPPYDPAFIRLELMAGHKVFIGGINLRILPNDWSLSNLTYVELDGLLYPTTVDPSPIPQAWTDINNQFALLGANGGWNYETKDPGDGTTPPTEVALAAFNAVSDQFVALGASGGWNYQPH